MEFASRFLYPAEAVLLLVSKPLTGVGGATMTFSLKTKISHIKPAVSTMHLMWNGNMFSFIIVLHAY